MNFLRRIALVLALLAGSVRAAELPSGFVEEILATGLDAATALTALPDGRIFIAEQTGRLLVWKADRVLDQSALDLTARVDTYWERGLIGVTLHPEFPRTPHLFVLYVAKSPFTHHVLSRFTLNGDVADSASETVLLEGDDQKLFGGSLPGGHQGGPLRFGPDGKLYLALGEQTAGNPAQSLAALQGKILRLNPDGSIPGDNPFTTQTIGKYRAIWALGLRNPFGLAFQPGTGRLFANDVGQTSWEEINAIERGGNYGWPRAEGMSSDPAFKNPLHTYPPVIGRSITGGEFYQPPRGATAPFPASYSGKYFFLDFMAHWLKTFDPENPKAITTFARNLNGPVALAVAPDGTLLVLNRGTIWRDGKRFVPNSGTLIRIRYTAASAAAAAATPMRLSEAGVFASLEELRPRDAFVGFEINAPPWQPGVRARRWISLPPGEAIKFSADAEWGFPAGTVIAQHYELERSGAPFETHLFWFTGSRLTRAAAYCWRADRRDADLIEDAAIVPLPGDPKRHWFSPGAERQLNLDLVVSGFLLPVSTRQLHRDHQLEEWNARGWFTPKLHDEAFASLPRLAALDDQNAPLEVRVRSFLDVNCSACHRPGGLARGDYDARFVTPLAEQKLINGELLAGDLGLADARVVVPGHPEKSVLYQRISRTDFFRMPPVSVNNDPSPALPVLAEWIRQLKAP